MAQLSQRFEAVRVAVVFGDADQRGGERAEGVRQRSPLRHRGHRHPNAHGCAQRRAQQQANNDPGVGDDLEVYERADDRHQHPEFREVHSALRGFGMAQALETENEKNRGEKITEFDEVGLPVHFDFIRRFRRSRRWEE